jgi:hypothetical protein
MRYRQLGRSGLRVSELTLGAMNFGNLGPGAPVHSVEVDEARTMVDRALEAGINPKTSVRQLIGGRRSLWRPRRAAWDRAEGCARHFWGRREVPTALFLLFRW